MKRSILALAVLCAAAVFPMVGCSDDDSGDTDARDDGRDVREDVGADADGDADAADADAADADADAADADGDADVEAGPCGTGTCPNDPVDGPIGEPCTDDTNCESGIRCIAEQVEVFEGEDYISFQSGYCLIAGIGTTAGCDPEVADSCPDGAQCEDFGADDEGNEWYYCVDSCSAASSAGVPWTNNCDCRDGYTCYINGEFCFPGCSNDRECCEIFHDLNGNYDRDDGEVTVLPASECTETCDPCTFACTAEGCPSGTCDIMDPCEHDSDCPANARCLDEYSYGADSFPGGMCLIDRCDLEGRECPTGAGCANLGYTDDPFWACLKPCTAGTQPGDTDFACRDAGVVGTPEVGDYACFPASADAWFDSTTATGMCFPGNFAAGTSPLGQSCTVETECLSPLGLGNCRNFGEGLPMMCSAACGPGLTEDGICDTAAGGTLGSGVCLQDVLCLAGCDHPSGNLGTATTGCPEDNEACYPSSLFTGYLTVATGATVAAGICWTGCTSNADCAAMWVSMTTCDVATGICGTGK